MPELYERSSRLLSRINLILAVLGACVLSVIALIIFFEVFSRTFLGVSRLWVIEVAEYGLVYLTFLGAPYLLEKNQHVTIDLIYDAVRSGPKLLLAVFNNTAGALLCLALAYAGLQVVLDQAATGVREASVMAPQKYWISLIFPGVMLLMALQFAGKLLRTIVQAKGA
ncbi:hypothetical protein RA19_07370 [Leisingera sp. ANG-M1]|uniref:TRAP transporter small permease n=1 Tax=Leisingera sp. ANG-M1 TaxID=1577895 RepID=UPI00057CB9F3|nr:TRAP transporter small permease [Leisingera sp. ANG-M1]KIC11166.1 hypothetical protein RA19_07370 [Leisingera sp. ANG-M1]